MKPEWKDAPEWANYLAMDSNGEWFWYECPPESGFKTWIVAGGDWAYAEQGYSWTETKEYRPALPQVSRNEKPC